MIWAWSRTNEHQSLRALIKQTHSKNTDATWCNIKCSNCSELRFGSVFCVIFLQQKLTYYYILNVTQNFASIEMRPPRFLGKSQSFDILSISGISKIFKNHGISWLSIERVLHNRQAHLLGLTTECTTWCKVNWLLNTFWYFWALRDIERYWEIGVQMSSGCVVLSNFSKRAYARLEFPLCLHEPVSFESIMLTGKPAYKQPLVTRIIKTR